MSDEPQPLRLKPRPPSGGETPSPPAAAPPAAADRDEGTSRLRLKPRLNLADDSAARTAPESEPFIPQPADPSPAPAAMAGEPSEENLPVFKLRPKAAPSAPAPPPRSAPPGLPEPPAFAGTEASALSAPPEPPAFGETAAPFPAPEGDQAPPPAPPRSASMMPPVSILSAPPDPGGEVEPPAAPGAVPRLSMTSTNAPPPPAAPKAGLNLKVAGDFPVKGGKPPGMKVAKPGSVLRKRSALSPFAKAGLGIVVVAITIAGVFFYRYFFPPRVKVVPVALAPIAKPVVKEIKDAAAAAAATAANAPADAAKLAEAIAAKRAAEQARVDAAAEGKDVPTPTPASESVMEQSVISSDVKVNNTHLDAAPAASPAFRTFVAGANIGGVFQGSPSRALINGTIVREGQIIESSLGISFDRIDADQKIIYFKDATGAEVSKNY